MRQSPGHWGWGWGCGGEGCWCHTFTKSQHALCIKRQRQFGWIIKMNSLHKFKTKLMPSFGQQQPTNTLFKHRNRLSNPFRSGSCQKKSFYASQTELCVRVGFGSFCLDGERRGGQVSGWRSVQGRPVSSAGCSEPEQSCPSLARQSVHWSSMKSPYCVCYLQRTGGYVSKKQFANNWCFK